MSQSMDLFDAPDPDALRPPRLPDLDGPAERSRELARAEASRMGTCVGMLADGVFFASLLGIAVVVRTVRPEIFSYGRYFLDARFGVVQSSLLLASALVGTLSIRYAAEQARTKLAQALGVTLLFGLGFLGLDAYEATSLATRGLLPGAHYTNSTAVWTTPAFRAEHPAAAHYAERFRVAEPPRLGSRHPAAGEPTRAEVLPLVAAGALGSHAVHEGFPSEPRNAHVFFGLFCTVTAIHALHVLAGLFVWGWLFLRTFAGSAAPPSAVAADSASLYWNVVALMRVALYPLFYLFS
jgi:heme/copper-type cytochrome/quinol oxidase subunit 3